jgi:hypothetical protein
VGIRFPWDGGWDRLGFGNYKEMEANLMSRVGLNMLFFGTGSH